MGAAENKQVIQRAFDAWAAGQGGCSTCWPRTRPGAVAGVGEGLAPVPGQAQS
jgi:hypothetical protein